jgi:hypothetical protein
VIWLWEEEPTATQLVGLPHDTAVSVLNSRAGSTLPTILHLVPFHRCTRVFTSEASPSTYLPTAVQLVALTQEMPSRAESAASGFGLVRIDQLAPFHCSTTVVPT